tara:strand:- start:682 stop:984 length:303 start_codon:yes stop_codon:yes gene_type:complete
MKSLKITVPAAMGSRVYLLTGETLTIQQSVKPMLLAMFPNLPPLSQWGVSLSSLGINRQQLEEGLRKMEKGELIQVAFPDLSADQRESILTPPETHKHTT